MTVTYEITAKPTLYKGQTFRSRLEAKWAVFFDILEWEWVYEPFDLGGWSPDFAIRAPGAQSLRKIVLVEVKPIMEFDEDIARKMEECCPSHLEEDCEGDGYSLILNFELLLLGVSPMFRRYGNRLGGCETTPPYRGWAENYGMKRYFSSITRDSAFIINPVLIITGLATFITRATLTIASELTNVDASMSRKLGVRLAPRCNGSRPGATH
jgi:hypothetical protein